MNYRKPACAQKIPALAVKGYAGIFCPTLTTQLY